MALARSNRLVMILVFLLLGGGLLVAAGSLLLVRSQPSSPISAIGGPFSLTATTGKTFTEKDLIGKPTLLFFGFTHCPDICPTAMFEMTQVFDALGADAGRVNALFVSVDPERDDVALLKTYLSSFHSNIVGLTGSVDAMQAMAKAYRVYFRKVPLEKGSYTMDHTAAVYLMGKNGQFVGLFDMKRKPADAAADLKRYF